MAKFAPDYVSTVHSKPFPYVLKYYEVLYRTCIRLNNNNDTVPPISDTWSKQICQFAFIMAMSQRNLVSFFINFY